MNAKQETLGEERFLTLVKAKANENVLQIKQEILKALKMFMGDYPQHDDIAMIILRCDDSKPGENK